MPESNLRPGKNCGRHLTRIEIIPSDLSSNTFNVISPGRRGVSGYLKLQEDVLPRRTEEYLRTHVTFLRTRRTDSLRSHQKTRLRGSKIPIWAKDRNMLTVLPVKTCATAKSGTYTRGKLQTRNTHTVTNLSKPFPKDQEEISFIQSPPLRPFRVQIKRTASARSRFRNRVTNLRRHEMRAFPASRLPRFRK
jgi:hypothetical protein